MTTPQPDLTRPIPYGRKTISPNERLTLATQINELLDNAYPPDSHDGHEEALVLALRSRTAGFDRRYLLGTQ